MDTKQSVHTFWRFHPVTGADANQFDTSALSDKQREELVGMVRAGAKFYWQKTTETRSDVDQGYVRAEYSNIKFVLDMMGTKYIFQDVASNR